MSTITKEELQSKIKLMLKDADLDKVTAKSVRISHESEYKESFEGRKKEINTIISDIINQSSSSSSSEDEIIDQKIPVTKKPMASKVSKEQASSGSEDDETVARKLQEEEMSGRRTRSGGNNKKSGSGLKRKKSKSTSNGSNEGSKKVKSGGGYMKPLPLSYELAEFTGETEMPRHAVVKRVWDYCKENNLMDPKNKQFAICDEKLQRLVGVKRFRMFGMMKLLGKHFIPDN